MQFTQPVAERDYRLRDGSRGTEYEALLEVVHVLEAKQRTLDEQIELTRKRMETAEGHP